MSCFTGIGSKRSRYDYIVIDTAPVGMVSDTMLIRRVTDVMLFIVRAGYTAKKSFALLDKIVSSGRFPAPYLVVNGVDMESRSYGYRRYGYIRLMVMMPDGYPHRKKASRNSKVIIYAPTPSPAEGVFCYQQKGAFYRAGRFSLKKNIYICFLICRREIVAGSFAT